MLIVKPVTAGQAAVAAQMKPYVNDDGIFPVRENVVAYTFRHYPK